MTNDMTLKVLKTKFEIYTQRSFTAVSFLKQTLPKYLYQNEDTENDINLCGPYDGIRNWLSHLMNNKSCTKSGANHVRTILLKLIQRKPETIAEIAQNCKELIPSPDSLVNDIQTIFKSNSSINSDFRVLVTSLLDSDCYQAFACCIIYSLFPDNQKEILNLMYSFCTVSSAQILPDADNPISCLHLLHSIFSHFLSDTINNNHVTETAFTISPQKWESCERALSYVLSHPDVAKEHRITLQNIKDQINTLKYWDEIHPSDNVAEAVNNLGKKFHLLANLEITLNKLIVDFERYQ